MERPEQSYYNAKYDFAKFHSESELEEIKKEWIDYINSKYTVGYSEENTCVKFPRGSFHHFGIHPKAASMYGELPENILKCKVTIIEDNISLKDRYKNINYDNNSTEYFGWISYDDNDDNAHGISLIQPNIKIFGIQFPGGGDYEVTKEMGKIVVLKIEII